MYKEYDRQCTKSYLTSVISKIHLRDLHSLQIYLIFISLIQLQDIVPTVYFSKRGIVYYAFLILNIPSVN